MNAETQALIEEARTAANNPYTPYPLIHGELFASLADALEASEAARKDLTDKIEELRDRLFYASGVVTDDYQRGRMHAEDDIKRELDSLVSGDKKERSDG